MLQGAREKTTAPSREKKRNGIFIFFIYIKHLFICIYQEKRVRFSFRLAYLVSRSFRRLTTSRFHPRDLPIVSAIVVLFKYFQQPFLCLLFQAALASSCNVLLY